jgi:hypothetical protein
LFAFRIIPTRPAHLAPASGRAQFEPPACGLNLADALDREDAPAVAEEAAADDEEVGAVDPEWKRSSATIPIRRSLS